MPKPSQPRLWTLEFSLLCAAALLVYGGHMVLNPTVPMFLTTQLGRGSVDVGLVGSLFTFVALFARPLSGYAIDRWNRRTVLIVSALWFALSMGAHALVGSFALLVTVRMLHGIPFSGVTTAMNTVAADLSPPSRRGEGISVFGFTQALAQAAGPSFALGMLASGEFGRVFALAGLATGIGALLVLAVRYPYRAAPTRVPFDPGKLIEWRIGWLGLAVATTYLGMAGIIYMIMLYAEQYAIAHVSWWYVFGPLGVILARMFAGRIFDQQGPRLAVAIGLGLVFAALAILAVFPNDVGFLVAALLQGLGTGILHPCNFAMAANMVEPERRGAAMATVFAALDLGIGIGSYVLGWIAQVTGSHAAMFAVAAAVQLVSAMLYTRKVLPDYTRKAVYART